MSKTSKNEGLINNDNQPQVSKELKIDKRYIEDVFSFRDFYDVMDRVDYHLLKKNKNNSHRLDDEFYYCICYLSMLLEKQNLIDKEDYFSWIKRRDDRLVELKYR